MAKKGLEKKKNLILEALQYGCLQADLQAVEAVLSQNQPLSAEEEPSVIKRWVGELFAQFENAPRRLLAEELETKKKEAEKAIVDFAASKKAIELWDNQEALQKYIDKALFKKDKNGNQRVGFALAFMIMQKRSYQFPEQALSAASMALFGDAERMGELQGLLQANYLNITAQEETQMQGILRVFQEVLSDVKEVLPAWAFDLFTLRGRLRFSIGKTRVENLSEYNENVFLASGLTVLQAARTYLKAEDWASLADDFLKSVNDLRADVEYVWVVETFGANENHARLSTYDRAVARLAEIARG